MSCIRTTWVFDIWLPEEEAKFLLAEQAWFYREIHDFYFGRHVKYLGYKLYDFY